MILVLGGGGFIGHHLINYLKNKGHIIVAVDLKYPEFETTRADEFIIGDLRNIETWSIISHHKFDQIYQFAADMGGAGYIFSGENDADIFHNSALINLNLFQTFKNSKDTCFFFSSSACVYSIENQSNNISPNCKESSVYPANPDSDYGWEKIFSERLFQAYSRNYNLNIKIARFHNVFGPMSVYAGGKEKAPSALCRKIALAKNGDTIEVWGDGNQTRSFLYIDECLKGIELLMNSNIKTPINIGSDEMIKLNDLAKMIIEISGKQIYIKNIPGPQGVRGRTSDNELIFNSLGWKPSLPLNYGIKNLYNWVLIQSKQPIKALNS